MFIPNEIQAVLGDPLRGRRCPILPLTFTRQVFTMEQHQPSSNSPYIEPTPIVSQQVAQHPTQVPDRRLQNEQRESNEQPSLICGFTSSELANVAIQVAGIITAAIFGAWAVKSYESSNLANRLAQDSLSESNDANQLAQAAIQQSLYANVLALINFCLSEQVSLL